MLPELRMFQEMMENILTNLGQRVVKGRHNKLPTKEDLVGGLADFVSVNYQQFTKLLLQEASRTIAGPSRQRCQNR
jgi:hypothetical protein